MTLASLSQSQFYFPFTYYFLFPFILGAWHAGQHHQLQQPPIARGVFSCCSQIKPYRFTSHKPRPLSFGGAATCTTPVITDMADNGNPANAVPALLNGVAAENENGMEGEAPQYRERSSMDTAALKLLPQFYGSSHRGSPREWLRIVTQQLDVLEYSPTERMRVVFPLFKTSEALRRRDAFQQQLGRPWLEITWDELREHIESYCTPEQDEAIYNAALALREWNAPDLSAHVARFTQLLCQYSGFNQLSEDVKKSNLRTTLSGNTKLALMPHQLPRDCSFQKLCDTLHAIANARKSITTSSYQPNNKLKTYSKSISSKKNQITKRPKGYNSNGLSTTGKTYYPNGTSLAQHKTQNTNNRTVVKQSKPYYDQTRDPRVNKGGKIQCYSCGQSGHYARNCPNAQRA